MAEVAQRALPDWENIDHAVECPLCRYNLRGLSEARCPECGFAFNWSEVLDPNRKKHPYLFEHHPERNFRSYLRTLWGGLRPGRFWRALHPVQPSRPWRLRLYALVIFFFAALPSALNAFLAVPPIG